MIEKSHESFSVIARLCEAIPPTQTQIASVGDFFAMTDTTETSLRGSEAIPPTRLRLLRKLRSFLAKTEASGQTTRSRLTTIRTNRFTAKTG